MKLAQQLVIGYYRAKLNLFAKLSKRKAAEKAFELFCTPYTSNKKKAPAVFEKAEKLHLKFENYQLVGYRWNHPQPKKALILHGFSSTIKKFDHFVIPPVPFLVDGNSDEVNVLLADFAASFSDNVQPANDDKRLKMHLAAVMVSNFTNHLYALTEDYCKDRKLDFKLLHPLIIEVACRLTQGHAVDMQTGPARRGDEETIKKHLLLLEIDEHLQDLYHELSESIRRLYRKK